MKTRPQTSEQINYVFSQPVCYPSLATVSYFRQIPVGFNVLNRSVDRGGKCLFEEITFSSYGNVDRIVLGVRVRDEVSGKLKEDLYEYDRGNQVVGIYSKGKYEKVNPLYKGTHHRKYKSIFADNPINLSRAPLFISSPAVYPGPVDFS